MQIVDGYSKLKVEFLNPEEFINGAWQRSVFDFVKLSWHSKKDEVYDEADPQHITLVYGALTGHTLPTVLEGLHFKFRCDNMSRACSHQFVRGRVGWAYNQESQGPEPISNRDITLPYIIYHNEDFRRRAEELAALSTVLYDDMVAADIPMQFARYIALEGSQTNIYTVISFPAFRGFISNRTCLSTADEINIVARMMRVAVLEYLPELEPYLHQPCDRTGKCTLVDNMFPCCAKYKHIPPKGTTYNFNNMQNNVHYELYRNPHLMVHNDRQVVDAMVGYNTRKEMRQLANANTAMLEKQTAFTSDIIASHGAGLIEHNDAVSNTCSRELEVRATGTLLVVHVDTPPPIVSGGLQGNCAQAADIGVSPPHLDVSECDDCGAAESVQWSKLHTIALCNKCWVTRRDSID